MISHNNKELLEETPMSNIDFQYFSYLAKHARLKYSKTQAEVAHGLVSVSHYSKIETGKIIPTYEIALAIAKRLDFVLPLRQPEGYQADELIDLVLKSLVLNEIEELNAFSKKHQGCISVLHQHFMDLVGALTSYQETEWLDVETSLAHLRHQNDFEKAILELLILWQYIDHHRFRDAMVFFETHDIKEQSHLHYRVLYHEAMYRLMSVHQKWFLTYHHHEQALKASFEAKLVCRYERLKLERIETLAKESITQAQTELEHHALSGVHPKNQNLFHLLKHRLKEEPIQVNETPLSYEKKDRYYYDLKLREAVLHEQANPAIFEDVPTVALMNKAKHDLHFKTTAEEKHHLLKTVAIPGAVRAHDFVSSIHFIKAQMALYIDQKRYKEAILCWQRWLAFFNF